MKHRYWGGFVVLVLANVVWLIVSLRSPDWTSLAVAAYGECRSAIRRARSDAARAIFPTLDLIRVSRTDSTRFGVRGFYQDRGRVTSNWYSCAVVRSPANRWVVENVVFDSNAQAPSRVTP